MDKLIASAMADIIDAIDTPDLASVVADGVSRVVPSDLVSLFLHEAAGPSLLHDNFLRRSWRAGLDRYIGSTHRADPFVLACRSGSPPPVFRLAQLARRWQPAIGPSLIAAGDEETGYRTQGWPPLMEEIGLGLPLAGARVAQLSLYRARRNRSAFSDREVRRLASLWRPLRAALTRLPLTPQSRSDAALEALTPRERQIAELLVGGRSSEAIALTLEISVATVKTHRKNIYRKLRVSSSLQLLRTMITTPAPGSVGT